MKLLTFFTTVVLASAAAGSAWSAEMADGMIKKIDAAQKKITIKHGELKDLEMPAMTMVFAAGDAVDLAKLKAGQKVKFTVAHFAATEARFRAHLKRVDEEKAKALVPLDNVLVAVTQDDVVRRRVFDEALRAFVPDFGVVFETEDDAGKLVRYAMSRHLVLLCVERRKAWRLLQSKAGIDNLEYRAQRALLARADKGEISRAELWEKGALLLKEEVTRAAAK